MTVFGICAQQKANIPYMTTGVLFESAGNLEIKIRTDVAGAEHSALPDRHDASD